MITLNVENSAEYTELLALAEETGRSFPLDFYCESRDRLFDERQLYAVFEHTDVEGLINALNESLATAYSVY